MKPLHLVATFCAAILVGGCASSALAPSPVPAETVRVIANGVENTCSAVVIAPDYALTARHCLHRGMTVDGLPVNYISAAGSENEDIGLLYASGLKCPCATMGARPAEGDVVVAVGFPYVLSGGRRTTETAAVAYIGTPKRLAPWVTSIGYADATYIVTDKVLIVNGDSGGGLFSRQSGVWRLVGINAVGIPVDPMTDEEQASGFVPVDLAAKFLPRV